MSTEKHANLQETASPITAPDINFFEWEEGTGLNADVSENIKEMDILEEHLKKLGSPTDANIPEIINISLRIGIINYTLQDYKSASIWLDKAYNLCADILVSPDQEVVTGIIPTYIKITYALSSTYMKLEEFDYAEIIIDTSLAVQDYEYHEKEATEGKMVCLYKLGTVYQAQENPEKALESYNKALAMQNALDPNANLEIKSKMLIEAGQIYKDKGNSDKATESYKHALEIILQDPEKSDDKAAELQQIIVALENETGACSALSPKIPVRANTLSVQDTDSTEYLSPNSEKEADFAGDIPSDVFEDPDSQLAGASPTNDLN